MFQFTARPGCLCLLLVAALSAQEAVQQAGGDKAALAPLQAYVGSWKGVGQPKRGSTKGAWTEAADWAWHFHDKHAALTFKSPQGKYFQSGEIEPGDKAGEFKLTATLPDGKTQETYVGKLTDGQLTFAAATPAEGRPTRITLRQIADGDRMLVLLEQQAAGSDVATRLAEVGYTRQGSGFGKGSGGRECVVTGGLGTIAVTFEGKTYYVCCTGCRDLFNEDPAGILVEYKARKDKERAEKK